MSLSPLFRMCHQPGLCLSIGVCVLIAVASTASAVIFEYESGTFSGQRGAGMIFAGMLDDGWIEHWNEVPDPEPASLMVLLLGATVLVRRGGVVLRQMYYATIQPGKEV